MLHNINKFTYLDSTLPFQVNNEKLGFGSPKLTMHLSINSISLRTKPKVYLALVINALYVCPSWIVYDRSIFSANWWGSNGREGLLTQRSSSKPTYPTSTLFCRKSRQDDKRLSKLLLYDELVDDWSSSPRTT